MALTLPVGVSAPSGPGHPQEDDIVHTDQLRRTTQPLAKGHWAPAVPPLGALVLRPTVVNLGKRAVVHAAVVLHARQTIMNTQ